MFDCPFADLDLEQVFTRFDGRTDGQSVPYLQRLQDTTGTIRSAHELYVVILHHLKPDSLINNTLIL
jgi:hypothetical protein